MVSLLILLALAWAVGRQTGEGSLGVLIDTRGRYSLTHFQLVLWTLVILSSMLGVLISRGFDATAAQLSPELLGLMGISAGSGVFATGVKGAKDTPGSGARVARAGAVSPSTGATMSARFAQIWLEEEGDLADKVVSITKYQNFVFTLVILVFYISTSWTHNSLPDLPQSVIWLIGISHAGYVGGKIPNKS
jgi:hypothetical protein